MSAGFVAKNLHLSHGVRRASLEADDEEDIEGFPMISPRSRRSSMDSLPIYSVKDHTSRSRAKSWTSTHPQQTLVWAIVWYFFATASTFMNKQIIKTYHFPAEVLTIIHLLVGTLFDALLLMTPPSSTWSVSTFQKLTDRQSVLRIIPLSLLGVTAKIMTYWSYDRVPVAMTHTAKASSPLFNVALAYVVYGKRHQPSVYLSLLPIVIGVALASVSEVHLNDLAAVGVFFAVMSSLLGVVASMYSKYLLLQGIVKDSVNLHFYNGATSLALNLPTVLYYVLTNSISTTTSEEGRLGFRDVPIRLLLTCSVFQFCGSLVSYYILSKADELTYSVLGTLKRVVIVMSAMIFFSDSAISFQSFIGSVIAMFGIGCYHVAKRGASSEHQS